MYGCIGACVRAFQFCLPVICIDGTFLTVRYKCQILTAIGVDCNNQIVPLAFAFVENENLESWYWFLEQVRSPDRHTYSEGHVRAQQRAKRV